MRRIELPSNELVLELQRHLQQKRFPVGAFDKGRRELQFPDSMNQSEWSNIKAEAEKWAKGKNLEVSETIRLQGHKSEQAQEREEPEVDPKEQAAELKKRLDGLTPEKAEQRYNYLASKPLSELSDVEYQERIALAARASMKQKK